MTDLSPPRRQSGMHGKANGVKEVSATINAPLQPFFGLLQIKWYPGNQNQQRSPLVQQLTLGSHGHCFPKQMM